MEEVEVQENPSPAVEVEETVTEEVLETASPEPDAAEEAPEETATSDGEESAPAEEDGTVPYSRFKEVYGQSKRNERDIEFWRTQALANQQAAQQQTAPQQQTPTPSGDEPREADFEDYTDYVKAIARHEYQQVAQQQQAQHHAAERQQATQAFEARCKDAAAQTSDWDEVVRAPGLQLSPAMIEEAAASEQVTDILYHLGNHPDECERISRLDQRSMAREMLRIEAHVSNNGAPPKRMAPKNLQPVKAVGQREGATVDIAKMSTDEYVAWANKRDGIA
jgi:hypothetical protein